MLLLPAAPLAAQSTGYRIQAIPTLGGASSFARDVSNNGLVTGNAQLGPSAPAPRLNAYLWDGSTSTNLGTLPGSNNFSRGYGVNDAGVVVGESDNNIPRAFRWENGTLTELPTLGGASAVAHAINNADQIVGISSNGTTSRPVMWENGIARDLGVADGSATGSGRAWSVNEAGDAVGLSRSSAGLSQATLWTFGGMAQSLGSLGSGQLFSEALNVNDAGQIVGRSLNGTTTRFGTSVFEAFVWQNGTMLGLGSLGFTFSQANGINNRGWIVGNGTNISGAPARALFWTGDTALDLNDRLVHGDGWTLRSAEAINERGQIVGYGTFDGRTQAFILTPVPEPGTIVLMASGLFALAIGARRRRAAS